MIYKRKKKQGKLFFSFSPLLFSSLIALLLLFLIIYSSLLSLCNRLGYQRPTPHLLTDTNIHSDTQAEPLKLSSLTLYIDLWQEGKPTPGKNPPVISPPVVIFRRIGVHAEVRTQNPVLSNTRLAKMVPLRHLRRLIALLCIISNLHFYVFPIYSFLTCTFFSFPILSSVFLGC
jgi:hypothetical protein